MLELTLTIVTILVIHYFVTNWRRRKPSYKRLLTTNQLEPKQRVKLAPVFRRIISGGKL